MIYQDLLALREDGSLLRPVTVRTNYDPKPVPSRQYDWSAIDDERYDGAEDSSNRNQIGYGATETEAIQRLACTHCGKRGYVMTGTPPAETPLSCYLLPEFWVGALASRREGRTLADNRISATEAKLATAYGEQAIPERDERTADEAAGRRNDEAVRDLEALATAARRGRDLAALPAYHRWLGQSTLPAGGSENEADG